MKNIKIGEHDVVLKDFLTARENRAIQAASLAGASVGADGKPHIQIDAEYLSKNEDQIIKSCVLSVDGVTDSATLLDAILDWPLTHYNELMVYLKPLMGMSDEKKDS